MRTQLHFFTCQLIYYQKACFMTGKFTNKTVQKLIVSWTVSSFVNRNTDSTTKQKQVHFKWRKSSEFHVQTEFVFDIQMFIILSSETSCYIYINPKSKLNIIRIYYGNILSANHNNPYWTVILWSLRVFSLCQFQVSKTMC